MARARMAFASGGCGRDNSGRGSPGHRNDRSGAKEEEEEEAQDQNEGAPLRWKCFEPPASWRSNLLAQQPRREQRQDERYNTDGLKAEVEVELSGKPRLKDGYLRLDVIDGLRVQAGRFKRQMSTISLDSRWDLPSVERGLLSTLDIEGLPFSGGRGNGAMLSYRLPIPIKTKVSASFFTSKLGSGVVLDPRDHLTDDTYFRATVEPIDGLELASSLAFIGYLDTIGDPQSFDHAPMASLELSYKGKLLDAWVEGFYGRSMVFSIRDAQIDGRFLAARALVSPRFDVGTPRWLIPFVGASYLDPRTSSGEDANSELQTGASLAFTKIWRLQFELSQSFAQGDFSPAIAGTAFRIQLGARFKD
jgi:hypothetical protein